MKYGPDKWDEKYSAKEYVYGKRPNQFLKENIDKIPKGKVLCVADGEGRNSTFLAEQGNKVTSIDFSPVAVEKILKLAAEKNVTVSTICADLLDYDFGQNKYNAIISIYSHFNFKDTHRLHQKYLAALKSNGIYLMEAFAKEQLPLNTGGPKNIKLLYNIDDIKKSFSNCKFEVLKKHIINLYEGHSHSGKAIVIRAIVRKP